MAEKGNGKRVLVVDDEEMWWTTRKLWGSA
jgi:hypothetical protein